MPSDASVTQWNRLLQPPTVPVTIDRSSSPGTAAVTIKPPTDSISADSNKTSTSEAVEVMGKIKPVQNGIVKGGKHVDEAFARFQDNACMFSVPLDQQSLHLDALIPVKSRRGK